MIYGVGTAWQRNTTNVLYSLAHDQDDRPWEVTRGSADVDEERLELAVCGHSQLLAGQWQWTVDDEWLNDTDCSAHVEAELTKLSTRIRSPDDVRQSHMTSHGLTDCRLCTFNVLIVRSSVVDTAYLPSWRLTPHGIIVPTTLYDVLITTTVQQWLFCTWDNVYMSDDPDCVHHKVESCRVYINPFKK